MSNGFSHLTPVRFGERLRFLRKQNKMTQQDVADYLQIHRTTYTKYETRCVTPDQEGLVRLAALFHVSVDYLLGRTPEDSPALTLQDDTPRPVLNEQEIALILAFRKLTAEQRSKILDATLDQTKK